MSLLRRIQKKTKAELVKLGKSSGMVCKFYFLSRRVRSLNVNVREEPAN